MSSKQSWDRFQDDMGSLGDRLRDAYRAAPTDSAKAELRASLERLEDAADAVFKTIDRVAQDPEVRAGTKRAAGSFGAALSETFRTVADELAGAVRSARGNRPRG